MEEVEKKMWEEYFSEALQGQGQEVAPSFWWKLAHADLVRYAATAFINRTYSNGKGIDVLEAGCGSATSSFELSHQIPIDHLYLLDISESALKFAKKKLGPSRAAHVHFTQGSVYHLGVFKEAVDLCWNVGLIEHYSMEEIRRIVKEMFSTLKPGGTLLIGMPNRYSIATLKAALLGSKFGKKWLRHIDGYRNQTEILYGNHKIRQMIQEVTHTPVHIQYAGSPTLVESSDRTIQFFRKYIPHSCFNFISCFIATKETQRC